MDFQLPNAIFATNIFCLMVVCVLLTSNFGIAFQPQLPHNPIFPRRLFDRNDNNGMWTEIDSFKTRFITTIKEDIRTVDRKAINAQAEEVLRLSKSSGGKEMEEAVDFFIEKGEPGEFIGVHGVPIATRSFPNNDAEGNLLPGVVVVQGWSESMLKYPQTIQDLHKMGYSVYTYDHRGQGLSGREFEEIEFCTHITSFHNYVDDLLTFCNQIPAAASGEPLSLVAHSMGCLIGLLAQKLQPEVFGKAVLSAPMFMPIAAGLPSLVALFVCKLVCILGLAGRPIFKRNIGKPYDPKSVEGMMISHDPQYRSFWSAVRGHFPRVRVDGGPSFGWLSEAISACYAFKRQMKHIKIPILLFQAGSEVYVKNRHQMIFQRKVPTVLFKGFPKAFHDVLAEEPVVRQKVMKLSKKFLHNPTSLLQRYQSLSSLSKEKSRPPTGRFTLAMNVENAFQKVIEKTLSILKK
mmetsp:Transcript_5877/g.7382  ORF Transcript_5877/g.7382 Transcript_5877/m.7382 type:complete len:462 (-) Transcript_5877:90-1475(-)